MTITTGPQNIWSNTELKGEIDIMTIVGEANTPLLIMDRTIR